MRMRSLSIPCSLYSYPAVSYLLCHIGSDETYVNDVQGLVHGSFRVEGEAGVDLSRDLAGDDLENLLAELDEESVERGIDLLVKGLSVSLAIFYGSVDELGVLWLLGGGEDQGRVGSGILGLVLVDGSEVAGVADDDLEIY